MNDQTNRYLRVTLILFSIAVLSISSVSPGVSQTSDKPNVVYILADDLGYGEIQVYNPSRGKVPTPNVNRLAKQGMMFTDAHSASAVCTPTRYALLTGRYAWRSRLQRGVIGPGGEKPLIKDKFKTLGDLYGNNGYHTAVMGKWHLGYTYGETDGDTSNRTAPAPVGAEVNGGPTTRGFDYFWGFALSRTMSTVVENGEVVEELPVKQMLPELARRGSDYVREHAEREKPFFLYLALNSPHAPVVPTDRFKGKTGLNDWADFVMETDWAVGQVLDALRASGEADNTIVVFASDNGTSPNASGIKELERQGYFPSALLRGYKTNIWEGGHRVPFIVRWPGVVEPGSINHNLVSLNDWYATTADLLDMDLPADQGVDSVSIMSLLNGSTEPVRDSVVHHTVSGKFGIRVGDWKLNIAHGSGGWGTNVVSDKEARKKGLPPIQLYNIKRNIRETRNLQGERPQKAKELFHTLRKQVHRGRSTPGPEQENAVEVDLWRGNDAARKRLTDE